MKVLITGQTPEDCQRLAALLDWGRLGVELLDGCDDGVTAMEVIVREWPDLVFADLDLPRLNGIELIERTKEHGIFCDFVLVAATGRFEDAQRVMRLGVEEFLLKPLPAEEAARVVEKYAERRRALDNQDMNERFRQTRRLLRNSFMDSLTSIQPPGQFSLESLNERYHLLFQEGIFQSVILTLVGLPNTESGIFLPALVESIRARFDPICYEMVPFIQGDGRLTLTINYSPDSSTEAELPHLRDILVEHLQKRGCSGASYAIGIGLPESSVQRLKRTLETAERAVRCGILRERNAVYEYAKLKFDGLTSVDILTQTLINEWKVSVGTLDGAGFERTLRSAVSPLSARTDPAVLIDICWAAVETVVNACETAGYAVPDQRERKRILDSLGNETTLTGVVSTLSAWVEAQFENCAKERQNSRPVREAMRYIRSHCTEALTLERVAEHVYLNASYFSTIFKKEAGQNFSEYLTQCRIEEAKRLLRESSLSVSSICQTVGYVDQKYFSRIFAKLVGVKPSTYRTLHG